MNTRPQKMKTTSKMKMTSKNEPHEQIFHFFPPIFLSAPHFSLSAKRKKIPPPSPPAPIKKRRRHICLRRNKFLTLSKNFSSSPSNLPPKHHKARAYTTLVALVFVGDSLPSSHFFTHSLTNSLTNSLTH